MPIIELSPVPPEQRIRELQEQVAYMTSQLARHKQTIARLLERMDRMERMFAELRIVRRNDDDLEMEPGVKVWTPVEVDE